MKPSAEACSSTGVREVGAGGAGRHRAADKLEYVSILKEEPMHQPDVLQVKGILLGQFILTFVLIAAALPFGVPVVLSVLVGAGVCLVASALFAFWIFRHYRAQDPGSIVMRFYGAEVIKLFLVLGLFTVAFTTSKGLNLPVVLAAYLAVQMLPPIFASDRDARGGRQTRGR